VPTLSATARARLPDSAFAYVDSQGRRRLPINDVSHVRNALARFDQVDFEDDAARERARERLLRAAKKHGIVPLGFFDGQLRKARGANVRSLPRGTVTFLLTDIEGSTRLLERLGDGYAGLLRVRCTRSTPLSRSSVRSVRRAGRKTPRYSCASACTPVVRPSPTPATSGSPSTSPHACAGRATVARSCCRPRRTIHSQSALPKASPSEVWGGIRCTGSPNRKRSGKSTSRICARNFLDHARLDRSGAREPTQPTPIETREHPRLWAIPPRSMHENPFEGCPGGDVSFVGDTRICLRSI